MNARTYHLLALGLTAATGLFLVLGAGALGIIGDGGRPDRVFVTVLVVAAGGAVVARLRPRGMVLALAATAFTQVVVTATALLGGLHEAEQASVVDILGINAMYVALWGASAWLFRQASVATQRDFVDA